MAFRNTKIVRNNKKISISLIICICILSIGLLYIYNNIPLRTAIYRSFAKQTTYITSEKDTIYSFGYFGIRKQLLDKNTFSLTLLNENSDFCKNCFVGHLIGRSGVINGNYLYVAARSYLGGRYKSNDKNYLKGKFLILRKSDLKVIKEFPMDYSMIETKIYKDYLVVTGLQGFNIYNIKEPISPKLIYSYRTHKPEEFQGCNFFIHENSLYIAMARFSDGISIYKIEKSTVICVKNIPIQGTSSSNGILTNGMHVFNLKVKYPYIYATLAPTKKFFRSPQDNRGIIIYDVSNINDIKHYAVLIPRSLYYSKITGDPQPSYIEIYKNKIYTNFGEKGIAVFSLADSMSKSQFVCIKNYADGNMILPIYIDNNGILYMGGYNNEKIYIKKID